MVTTQKTKPARPPDEYDLEADIGVRSGDSADRTLNASRWTEALDAAYGDGRYLFTGDNPPGPVMRPFKIPAKTFYFDEEVLTNTRIGCVIKGYGGGGYLTGSEQFQTGGSIGGAKSRLVFTGGAGKRFFRFRGNGDEIRGVDILGREYINNAAVGTKATACITIEGHSTPDCGRPIIRFCGLHEAESAIHVLGGYFDDDEVFHASQQHGDLGFVQYIESFNCGNFFLCENEQALVWAFKRILIEYTNTPVDCTVFNMQRGGFVHASVVTLDHSKVAVLSCGTVVEDHPEITGWSPGTARHEIHHVFWENFGNVPTNYLTLFRWGGRQYNDPALNQGWAVRMTGTIGNQNPSYYDKSKLIDISEPGVVTDDMLFDFKNLPMDNFTRVDNSQWVKTKVNAPSNIQEVVGGVVSVTPTQGLLIVDTEDGASSDDLTTINCTERRAGRRLAVKALSNIRTVTLKDGAVNLRLEEDLGLVGGNLVDLMDDGTSWFQLAPMAVNGTFNPTIAHLNSRADWSDDGQVVDSAVFDSRNASLIVVTLSAVKDTLVAPTDNQGNTYLPLPLVENVGYSTNRIWYCLNPTTSANHIIYYRNSPSSGSPVLGVGCFSGVNSYESHTYLATGLGTSAQTGILHPSVNGALLIVAATYFTVSGSINGGFASQSHFLDIRANKNVGGGIAWYIQPTAADINPTISYAESVEKCVQMACFI